MWKQLMIAEVLGNTNEFQINPLFQDENIIQRFAEEFPEANFFFVEIVAL